MGKKSKKGKNNIDIMNINETTTPQTVSPPILPDNNISIQASIQSITFTPELCKLIMIENHNLHLKIDDLEAKLKKSYNKEDELRATLNTSYENNAKISNDLLSKITEVEQLQKENAELKEKIRIMEEQIEKQNIEITRQNNEIGRLNNDVELLKTKLNNSNIIKIKTKILVAIQDINSMDKLDTETSNQFPQEIKNKLKSIKKKRVNECHYIDNTDKAGLKQYKKTKLYEKLKQMFNEKDAVLESLYRTTEADSNVIKNLIEYLEFVKVGSNTLSVKQCEKNEVDEWWMMD